MSKDFDKLKSMVGLLEPGAIYVSGTKPFAATLSAIKPLHSAVIVSGEANDSDAISFRSIAATLQTPDVENAFVAITPDTIAKFLFTSGSTGTPKAMINTQRMLTSSQQAKAQAASQRPCRIWRRDPYVRRPVGRPPGGRDDPCGAGAKDRRYRNHSSGAAPLQQYAARV
jgi:acyl-CoA synthetase (AMP-forming)/AMP-acid ligase II